MKKRSIESLYQSYLDKWNEEPHEENEQPKNAVNFIQEMGDKIIRHTRLMEQQHKQKKQRNKRKSK